MSYTTVQLSTHQVTYLELPVSPTYFIIPMNRQFYTFLGSFLFLYSYPLYEASLGPTHELLLIPVTKAFQRLQEALLNNLDFHLPDLSPLFFPLHK